MKKLAMLLGVLLAASTANAQVYEQSFEMVSVTTPPLVEVVDRRVNAWVFLRSSAIASVTLVYENSSGATMATQAVATGTNYTSVTLPTPLYMSRIRISPTTLTGVTGVSATVIQVR
jgi:hypothetical protein